MLVLHVATRANVGGVSRWLSSLLGSADLGTMQHLLVVGSIQQGEIEDVALLCGEVTRISRLGRSVSVIDDVSTLLTLRSVIEELAPDVVNTHMAKAGALGRVAARSLRTSAPAVVHTLHGHTLGGYFGGPQSRAIAAAERLLAHGTDMVGAVGSQVAKDILAARIAPARKVDVLRPGVPDREWIAKVGARQTLCSNPDLTERIVAGWLGRLVRIKRPDRLLGAAAQVPDVAFLVGGGGPLARQFSRRSPENVTTLGWVDPVPFWSACDIAVLTSDNEGIPTALVEASLAGLPSVATRAGSVADVVIDGVTGLVVDQHPEAVAEAVTFLAKDVTARERMGRAARERALVEFSPAQMWVEHQALYEKAIEYRSSRRWL